MLNSEKLRTINNVFGVSVADYSSVLKISRETYYGWLEDDGNPSNDQVKRINEWYEISLQVSQFNNHRYGRISKTYLYNNHTLMDLLKTDVWNPLAIIAHCQKLSKILDARQCKKDTCSHGGVVTHNRIIFIGHLHD